MCYVAVAEVVVLVAVVVLTTMKVMMMMMMMRMVVVHAGLASPLLANLSHGRWFVWPGTPGQCSRCSGGFVSVIGLRAGGRTMPGSSAILGSKMRAGGFGTRALRWSRHSEFRWDVARHSFRSLLPQGRGFWALEATPRMICSRWKGASRQGGW